MKTREKAKPSFEKIEFYSLNLKIIYLTDYFFKTKVNLIVEDLLHF